MRSQAIIKSYLDSLLELTQADSINLYLPPNDALGIAGQTFKEGRTLLEEFERPENHLLGRLVSPQHSHCAVLEGLNDDSRLIPLNHLELAPANAQSRRQLKTENPQENICWLGLHFEDVVPHWLSMDVDELNEEDSRQRSLLDKLVVVGSYQLSQIESNNAMLVDPLTSLPCRTKFQSEIVLLLQKHHRLAVLMIHTGDFTHINKKFGHDSGDQVIWEIAQTLKNCIREDDLVSRFGGALFAVSIPISEQQEALTLAQKIQQTLQKPEYLGGAINLSFNVGIGVTDRHEKFNSPTERVTSLINKADQALKAAQSESAPSISIWQLEKMDMYNQRVDYIGGIFTADTATDYRNMLLLWDISNIIASKNQFDALLQQVVQRLGQTFDFDYAGIVEFSDKMQVTGQKIFSLTEDAQTEAVELLPGETRHFMNTLADKVAHSSKSQKVIEDELVLFAAPLNDEGKNCFFIASAPNKLTITNDSQMLFTALTKQIGRALNRARLEQQLNQQLTQQKQQLQNELTQLKEDLQGTSMFYCSDAMEQLMKQAKRAAMTDTTTLIIGESGTGKERLTNTLHKMSARKDKPLVIVDCGAIPETLIESELFGHVKGAFTGALTASKGKVFEADGGTLMLDEIGELPLPMQSKLLRFVQEKHYTPVGGAKLEEVDVKIIAVTNRELETEVEKGNFRQDLFYRLNVLTLRTPPLRQRPEDIPLLSKHFLKKFAQQFNQTEKFLSDAALTQMARYTWPGNIRELENRLMQATLLTDQEHIEWHNLNIDTPSAVQVEPVSSPDPGTLPGKVSNSHYQGDNTPVPTPHQQPAFETGPAARTSMDKEEYLSQLKQRLALQIDRVLRFEDVAYYPVGRWLEDDLLRLTYHAVEQNVKVASVRLGVSLSTFRRRIDKLLEQSEQQPQTRPQDWSNIEEQLQCIADGRVKLGPDCLNVLKVLVLEAILQQSPNNMAIAAALLGVSEPTLYKFKKMIKTRQDPDKISLSSL